MMMSPFSRCVRSWSIISSTVGPALTISITRRGFLSAWTSSAIECAPTTFVPLASFWMKSSTFETVRLNTATRYPWSFMFRTRFWPITARPINPMSQLSLSIGLHFIPIAATMEKDAATDPDPDPCRRRWRSNGPDDRGGGRSAEVLAAMAQTLRPGSSRGRRVSRFLVGKGERALESAGTRRGKLVSDRLEGSDLPHYGIRTREANRALFPPGRREAPLGKRVGHSGI